jgi:putative membrane protein
MLLAYLMPSVEIKRYGTAIIVAILIGLLNATVGFLIRLPLNILTLGLLSFFVKLLPGAQSESSASSSVFLDIV